MCFCRFRYCLLNRPADGGGCIQRERLLREIPHLGVVQRADDLLGTGNGDRGHAEFIHVQAQEQEDGSWLTGHLAAHAHPFAGRVGCLHHRDNQAQHNWRNMRSSVRMGLSPAPRDSDSQAMETG